MLTLACFFFCVVRVGVRAWVTAGDVVHARIFGRPVLVLSSLAAAQDLLEKRSANYSDRPRLILLAELCVPVFSLAPAPRSPALLVLMPSPSPPPGWAGTT